MDKKYIIKCPKCGAEYLPAEIFVTDYLGNPKNIIKDENGKIEHFDGSPLELKEEYECDVCGCKFTIEGDVTFTTKEVKIDFDEEFETVVYEGRVPLAEEE